MKPNELTQFVRWAARNGSLSQWHALNNNPNITICGIKLPSIKQVHEFHSRYTTPQQLTSDTPQESTCKNCLHATQQE